MITNVSVQTWVNALGVDAAVEAMARSGAILMEPHHIIGNFGLSSFHAAIRDAAHRAEGLNVLYRSRGEDLPVVQRAAGFRVDVVADQPIAGGLARGFDPAWIARQPRAVFEDWRRMFEYAGWSVRFDDSVGCRGSWLAGLFAGDRVPCAYFKQNPTTKVATIHAVAVDLRIEAARDYAVSFIRWVDRQAGTPLLGTASKSGWWAAPQTHLSIWSGVIRALETDPGWTLDAGRYPGGVFGFTPYQPGEWEAAFADVLRRSIAAGVRIHATDAPARFDDRLRWVREAAPDLEAELIGTRWTWLTPPAVS